jgi:hypothetical protein
VKAWIFVALAHPLTGHHIDVVVSGTDDDGENKSRYRFVWRLSR